MKCRTTHQLRTMDMIISLTDIILGHGDFFNLNVNGSFGDLDHLHVACKTKTRVIFLVAQRRHKDTSHTRPEYV